jgi:hypothetical protein
MGGVIVRKEEAPRGRVIYPAVDRLRAKFSTTLPRTHGLLLLVFLKRGREVESDEGSRHVEMS